MRGKFHLPRSFRMSSSAAAGAVPSPDAPNDAGTREVTGVIERVITNVPAPRTRAVEHPDREAALISASLALPPGPLGMLTVLPDIYLIWQTQRQMVSDIFALYGRSAELTRVHMLYCLFRHTASHVLRDVAVRAGQRFIVQQVSHGALRSMLGSVGLSVTQRIAGTTASRWVPVLGAAAVGSYAYWDTLQVAKTARRLLVMPTSPTPDS